jgi:hypothetical protein
MKTISISKTIAAVTAVCFLPSVGAAAPRDAETLSTPALFGSGFQCLVTNVGTEPIVVSVQIFDGFGVETTEPIPPEEIEAGFCTDAPLAPRAICNRFAFASDSAVAHCRITILSGRRRDVRGSLESLGGNAIAAE